jgi:hypothetical protein
VKKPVAALAVLSTVAVSLVAAAPARAYDRDAYAYAAGHMIERSDVPKDLGVFRPGPTFFGAPSFGRNQLCDVPQSDAQAQDVVVRFPASVYDWSANYNQRSKGPASDMANIGVSVYQYSGAKSAIRAFDVITKNIERCTGTGVNTWTDDSGTTSYSTEVTHGVVPSVTVTGVESVFVNSDSLTESSPGDTKYVNDQYSVLTLVDDVVIQTTFYSNTNANLTTRQRKAVDQVAFNAVTRWLG